MALVAKSDNCWEWTAYRGADGYGRFFMPIGADGQPMLRTCLAHRASYLLFVGEIADGLYALHRCDNRGCVRPSHLFLGTHTDNMRDMVAKGRSRPANCKLTASSASEIRRRREQGEPQALLAREFGIHQSTISRIATGKFWRGAQS